MKIETKFNIGDLCYSTKTNNAFKVSHIFIYSPNNIHYSDGDDSYYAEEETLLSPRSITITKQELAEAWSRGHGTFAELCREVGF